MGIRGLGNPTARFKAKFSRTGKDAATAAPPGFTATGGTKTTSGDYTIHTFNNSGALVVTGGPVTMDYLVVAGGGGSGGANNPEGGGGGGGGGYRTATGFTVNAGSNTVTVGAGGAGGVPGPKNGSRGGDSVFSTITSTGGGGGVKDGPTSGPTSPGGSGGGGRGGSNSPATNPDAGTTNTGGGGGGSRDYPSSPYRGAAGGSGIAYLSVLTAQYSGTTSGSPTVTTSGNRTIMKFTGNGSYTI